MQTNNLQARFLENCKKRLFPHSSSSIIQETCFRIRFHPEYFQKTRSELIELIQKELNNGFNGDSMEKTIGEVVKKSKDTFASQLKADGVELPELQRGRPSGDKESPWKLLYHWLWEKEFPRYGWELATEIAAYADRGLQMQELNGHRDADRRDLDLSDLPDDRDNEIKLGESYKLKAWFPQVGFLLLINQGVSGKKFCVCPSKAFAPENQIGGTEIIEIPGDRSLAKQLRYQELGDEHFLAIVTPEPLNLSWVRPDSPPKDLEIDESRLTEIFQQVSRQSSSQVFYKTFRVIDRADVTNFG